MRFGAVEVSSLHANFFVHHGDATAADVERLVELVKARVTARFGVRLQPEIRRW